MELTEALSSLCTDTWSQLHQTVLTPLPDDGQRDLAGVSFASALQWFTETSCTKFITLPGRSDEETSYLENLGISPAHLLSNLKAVVNDDRVNPIGFQLDMVRRGSIQAVSPFDGRTLDSNQSFLANINVLFYRFETDQVFYLAVAGIGSGFRKSAIYFPESDLVVLGGDAWGFQADDLLELKARMVSNAQICFDYLSRDSKEKRGKAVCLGFYHFAHHLWNEVSGVARLQQKGLLRRVDKFLVLREPLGPLEEIFPEIESEKIGRRKETADLFLEILEKNYFAIRVGDNYLSRDVAGRVARVASAHASGETLAEIRSAKENHTPLVWLGIRVGNRAWSDQVEGLTEVIAELAKEFPGLGVVFDGFSVPGDRVSDAGDEQGYSALVAQEQEVVNAIRWNLHQRQVEVGLYNIIGRSIFDANVWAHAIDVYVSPHGSLQHKVGWFTNKHGIVHANTTLLESPPNYIWNAVENGIPPRYLNLAAISDLDSDEVERIFYNEIKDAGETGAGIQAANKRVQQNPEFMNYSIDWRVLHDDLVALIRNPKTPPKMAAWVLAHRMVRRLRAALGLVLQAA